MSDEDELNEIVKEIGDSPDIIIDDASHAHSHQIMALIKLFPLLKDGGIYILEDLGTSFGDCIDTWYDDACITGFEFCQMINELLTGCMKESKQKRNGSMWDYAKAIAGNLDMMCFIQGSCIMIKGKEEKYFHG